MTAAKIRIPVLIGANEHPALYPNKHGLLTYGKGIIFLIAAIVHAAMRARKEVEELAKSVKAFRTNY